MNFKQALLMGFKIKAFHIYGRASRSEFWYFYLTALLLILISPIFNFINVVGSLIMAIVVIVLTVMMLTATIRRLHDINKKGFIAFLPTLLFIVYFIVRIPMYALQRDYADIVCNAILALVVLSQFYVWFLCSKLGNKGNNKYGTDPLDTSKQSQDFINPRHMENPEYLGDPWRKFKERADREKQQDGVQDTFIAVDSPSTKVKNTTTEQNETLNKENSQHEAKAKANDSESNDKDVKVLEDKTVVESTVIEEKVSTEIKSASNNSSNQPVQNNVISSNVGAFKHLNIENTKLIEQSNSYEETDDDIEIAAYRTYVEDDDTDADVEVSLKK